MSRLGQRLALERLALEMPAVEKPVSEGFWPGRFASLGLLGFTMLVSYGCGPTASGESGAAVPSASESEWPASFAIGHEATLPSQFHEGSNDLGIIFLDQEPSIKREDGSYNQDACDLAY